MRYQVRKTSKMAWIRFNGKTYKRRVYEFLDPDTRWWRECVKQGSMCGSDPNAFIVLDFFENGYVRDEGAYMPGTWASY